MSHHRHRSPRHRHHVPRGTTTSTHSPPIAPPEIQLSGQAVSRLRVWAGPDPRKKIGTSALVPLCRTARDDEEAQEAYDAREFARRIGYGGSDPLSALRPWETEEDRTLPLFSRTSTGHHATVGLTGLRGKLERQESNGHWTEVALFKTLDAGEFNLPASLQLRKRYRLTLIFDPLPDQLVVAETEHQRTVPPPADAGVYPWTRPLDEIEADPDRLRYQRETVVVEFTMPRALPAPEPGRSGAPFSFVEMHARYFLFDANDDERQIRNQPDTTWNDERGSLYDEERWQACLHGPHGSEGAWLELWDMYAVALGTFVLEVPWMSQRRRDPAVSDHPAHLNWRFHHPQGGALRDWTVPAVHLCGAACAAMIARYYGYVIDAADTAIGACRFFTDGVNAPELTGRALWDDAAFMWPAGPRTVIAGSRPPEGPAPPGGYDTELVFPGADGNTVVGLWPHMKDALFVSILEVLADVPTAERRWYTGNESSLVLDPSAARASIERVPRWSERSVRAPAVDRAYHRTPPTYDARRSVSLWKHWEPPQAPGQPRITNPEQTILARTGVAQRFLSLGYPPIVFEDLEGSIEHGRVLFGVVLKTDGTVAQAYTHNPNHVEEVWPNHSRVIPANKGCYVLGRELSTSEVIARVARGSFGPDRERTNFIR